MNPATFFLSSPFIMELIFGDEDHPFDRLRDTAFTFLIASMVLIIIDAIILTSGKKISYSNLLTNMILVTYFFTLGIMYAPS